MVCERLIQPDQPTNQPLSSPVINAHTQGIFPVAPRDMYIMCHWRVLEEEDGAIVIAVWSDAGKEPPHTPPGIQPHTQPQLNEPRTEPTNIKKARSTPRRRASCALRC